MKIALVCSDSGSGGLIKYIRGFLETPTEHTVNLYCGKSVAIPDSDFIKVVRTDLVNESGLDLLFNRPLRKAFIEMVDRFSPDVVVFMNGFMRKGLQRYKCISILHNQLAVNTNLILKQKPLRLIGSLLAVKKAVLFSFRHADGNIFLSKASKDETDKRGFKYKSGKVILFGHEPAYQRNAVAKSNEMIYVSTQFPYKNHDRLIEALGVVRKHITNFHVTFIGCEQTAKLRDLIERHGIVDNVTFAGWLSREDTFSRIMKASIYLHPSMIESTSNGVLEGVIEGNTIVCSDLPVFVEALGDSAYYFSPYSIEEMADAIIQAITSPKSLSLLDCKKIVRMYDVSNGVNLVYDYAAELK